MKKKEFSIILKELRYKKGISQEKLAKDLNMTRRAYSSYECGECEPSIETLILMAEYFNKPLDILLGRYIDNTVDENEIKLRKCG